MNSTAFSVRSESLPLSRCHRFIRPSPNSLIFFNSFIKARMTGNDTCSGISKANKLSKVDRSQICSRHIPNSNYRKKKLQEFVMISSKHRNATGIRMLSILCIDKYD